MFSRRVDDARRYGVVALFLAVALDPLKIHIYPTSPVSLPGFLDGYADSLIGEGLFYFEAVCGKMVAWKVVGRIRQSKIMGLRWLELLGRRRRRLRRWIHQRWIR